MDDEPAAVPGRRSAPAHAVGRHRAARWRPSRRALAVGAGLAAALGAVAIVAQPSRPDPLSAASPALGPVAAPPVTPTGPPAASATPSPTTSKHVERVASGAPTRSRRSRPATPAVPISSRYDDEARADEVWGEEVWGDDGEYQVVQDGGDWTDEAPGNGRGLGRGRGN